MKSPSVNHFEVIRKKFYEVAVNQQPRKVTTQKHQRKEDGIFTVKLQGK